MKNSCSRIQLFAVVLLLSIGTSANAALVSRLGGLAYYDDQLNITWATNANINGTDTWANQMAWVASLSLDGVTGWRLPDTNPIDGTTADDATSSFIGTEDRGYNISAPSTLYAGSHASEMAYLFYNTLGNKGLCDPLLSTVTTCSEPQPGWGLTNTGPFSNVQPDSYWSATEYVPDTGDAWYFYFDKGAQDGEGNGAIYYAWAVRSGDVAAVPIPAAIWLLGSGLIGLVGIARFKRDKKI
jgi:hypothetical protein